MKDANKAIFAGFFGDEAFLGVVLDDSGNVNQRARYEVARLARERLEEQIPPGVSDTDIADWTFCVRLPERACLTTRDVIRILCMKIGHSRDE